MGELRNIQSDLNHRHQQMKPKKEKTVSPEDENVSSIVEADPFMASKRLFGPKCSTVEWLGGFRAFECHQHSASD